MTQYNVVIERNGPKQRAVVPVVAESEDEAKATALRLSKSEWCFSWVPYGPPTDKGSVVRAVPMIEPKEGSDEPDNG